MYLQSNIACKIQKKKGRIIMKLVGLEVVNKAFGRGVITKIIDKRTIKVKFETGEKDFGYKDAFGKFLFVEDEDMQADIEEYINSGKDKPNTSSIKAKKSDANIERIPGSIKAKKSDVNIERIPGKRMIFWIFQGETFDKQCRGGYIWSPSDGCHHHERLNCVKKGDVILHGCDKEVVAISFANEDCRRCSKPKELDATKWQEDGLKVDCTYTEIKNPIAFTSYVDDIIRLTAGKLYQPFNKNGGGNQGYFYEIDLDLAKIFIRESVKYNGYLAEIDYIKEILSE